MTPWDMAARWINAVLLVVVGFIGFDTLFRLLEANEENVIVGFARSGTAFFLAPFQGMFDEQEFLLTALIAVLGYALAAGIALAVIRAVQASIRRRSVARTGASPVVEPPIGGPPGPTSRRAGAVPPGTRGSPAQSHARASQARTEDRTQPSQPPEPPAHDPTEPVRPGQDEASAEASAAAPAESADAEPGGEVGEGERPTR